MEDHLISLIVIIGFIALVALSAYAKRHPSERSLRLGVWFMVVALATVAVGNFLIQSASASVPCTKFVQRNFIGPLPAGTCRLVPTTLHWTKPSLLFPTPQPIIEFGNRDSKRIGDATKRDLREVVMIACGPVAAKNPAAGGICAAGVVIYFYLLGDTFETAADNGQCVHIQYRSIVPIHYWAYDCG